MTFSLAPVLDTAAAAALSLALRQAVDEGRPLILDGGSVEQAGQACLQVLAAGKAAAANAGLAFRIVDPGPRLTEMATLAGLPTLLHA